MKKSLFALIATLALMAQPSSATETVPAYFEQAYTLIEDMLLYPEKMDFKEVVFVVDISTRMNDNSHPYQIHWHSFDRVSSGVNIFKTR